MGSLYLFTLTWGQRGAKGVENKTTKTSRSQNHFLYPADFRVSASSRASRHSVTPHRPGCGATLCMAENEFGVYIWTARTPLSANTPQHFRPTSTSSTQTLAYSVGYAKRLVDLVPPSTRISICLLYTSPSPRDRQKSRMPSSA